MHTAQTITQRAAKFHAFLKARGAEVMTPTNEWELVRFRTERSTSVIYSNARGRVTFTGEAEAAWKAYIRAKSWNAGVAARRGRTTPEIQTLLTRDGEDCFLCGKPLGTDITVEHLCSVAHGGPSHIGNYALMHAKCNQECGHLSLMEKIELRDRYKDHLK